MPKPRSRFVCQSCGSESPRWLGKCPDCGEWNTLVEEVVSESASRLATRDAAAGSAPQPIAAIPMESWSRSPSGIEELDRVLGGGILPGSLVLVGGDPGIGKSTLLMQASGRLASTAGRTLNKTGEES